MPYGKNSSSKHARHLHVCGLCGKQVYGNGFQNHKRACTKRTAETMGLRGSLSYGEVLDAQRGEGYQSLVIQ